VSNANLVLVPSAAIVLAVIAANLIGDGFAARTRSRARQVVG
jgi:ABC-type dipeptide/oligopeptide/nickel transport system permease subunit